MTRADINARIALGWDRPGVRARQGAITRARHADPAARALWLERLRAAMVRRRADYGIPEAYLPLYRKARRVLGKRKAREQILELIAREQGTAPQPPAGAAEARP